MVSPIYSTSFAQTLSLAMNDFHEALTKRWREKYVEAIKDDSYDYPTAIQRPVAPTSKPLWEAHTKEARCHIVFGDCQYIKWVEGGQEGSLSAVSCPGDTGVDEPTDVPGTPADGGGMVTVQPNIKCGIGDNLKLIDAWAYGERDNVYYKLPLFDTHDLHALKDSHDAFVDVGRKLGLDPGSKPPTGTGDFQPVGDRDIVHKVNALGAETGEGQDFWAGWTGLAASRAKNGFFASVIPTMDNQSGITGSMANLYATRAAIIQKGRNDALYWCQWATKSCDDKATVKTDLRDGWAVVSGIGAAVGVYSAATGVGAVAGATISLVGFLGEKLLPEVKTTGYKYEIEEIVDELNKQIDDLNTKLTSMEGEYGGKVTELQNTIAGIDSYNLELYDLTQNNAGGDHGSETEGYTATIEDILKISQVCYETGEAYDPFGPKIDKTSASDKDLADAEGSATGADKTVQELRDQLSGYLSTTTGRYIVAANEVKKAAESYSHTNEGREAAFDRIMDDWVAAGVGDIDVHGDPEDEAKGTDRGDKHPKGHGEYETD